MPEVQPATTVSVPQGSHLVKEKETLYSIANHYGTSVSELVNLNPDLKTDKNGNRIIYAGSIIKVFEQNELKAKQNSSAGKTSMPKTKESSGSVSGNSEVVIHTVKSGDTLKLIAEKYGIQVEDLIAYNNLKDVKSSDNLSDTEIKNIKILATKKAVMEGTGVSKEFIDDLISVEKIHYKLYKDACGKWTIGIGHNTNAHKDTEKYFGRTVSDKEIYSLLARDIVKVQKTIREAIGKEAFNKLSRGQKEALYGLLFNVGGLGGSPKLKAALVNGDYVSAACEMNHIHGKVNGKKQVVVGLAKRRFMDISKFIQGSKFTVEEQKRIMVVIQTIYNDGFDSITKENTKLDYNAYAKKFLGKYIDKGWIKLK